VVRVVELVGAHPPVPLLYHQRRRNQNPVQVVQGARRLALQVDNSQRTWPHEFGDVQISPREYRSGASAVGQGPSQLPPEPSAPSLQAEEDVVAPSESPVLEAALDLVDQELDRSLPRFFPAQGIDGDDEQPDPPLGRARLQPLGYAPERRAPLRAPFVAALLALFGARGGCRGIDQGEGGDLYRRTLRSNLRKMRILHSDYRRQKDRADCMRRIQSHILHKAMTYNQNQ